MRALAQMLRASGLDPCLFRVLPEPASAAKQAIEAGVDKVVLTGSAGTGRAVLADLAPRLVPAAMELSGCDAVFVLDDADLGLTARAVIFALCLNDGATCIAPHRLFVSPRVAGRLEGRLAGLAAQAPPLEVPAERAEYAARLVAEAVAQGARVVAGRAEPDDISSPVILGDATPQMRLLQEDVFAPVLSIVPVESTEAALRADEHCPYALGASVFGGRRAAARLAERIRAGCVVVNDIVVPTADPRVAFGGRDRSGFGVTRGAEGLLEMTAVKSVVVQRSGWHPHLRGGFEEAEDLLRLYLAAAHGRSLARRLRALWGLVRAGWSLRRDTAPSHEEEVSADG
jgi:acyl-CoA reductase-like NAD-dependent aldehyde dehydrogenase